MGKRNGGRRSMWLIGAIVIVVVLGVVVFFNIPYSKTKTEFHRTAAEYIGRLDMGAGPDVFTKEELESLPLPVKRYFEYSGYLGTPKRPYVKANFKQVNFMLSPDKPPLTIDYTQYNFAGEPVRMAFIDTAMYGIPFQGFDSYVDGRGRMKGVLAKTVTLFNQTGEAMNKACLVTVLSESLILIPQAALQPYITWESMDDTHAKATISGYGISASGIFTFSREGALLSFATDDRAVIATDGTTQQVGWTAKFDDYKIVNGIRQPTRLQAVWNYDSGDLIYFDSDNLAIE
ncbi:hypothetical protein DFP94_106197 [Fontibacillus phaseoli]|uniref:Uncharacterized protein n=1 Tax=Fontibacillus phaseoli TaxID=1416533 RepID=A0A369BAW3_9BACL|nr:DUF6544 family protein [Fontibacillus phaseoli]RCX18663.1 hypothetical protein DFP94_106197 [Fontibacillus phaseoli]